MGSLATGEGEEMPAIQDARVFGSSLFPPPPTPVSWHVVPLEVSVGLVNKASLTALETDAPCLSTQGMGQAEAGRVFSGCSSNGLIPGTMGQRGVQSSRPSQSVLGPSADQGDYQCQRRWRFVCCGHPATRNEMEPSTHLPSRGQMTAGHC